VAVKFILVGAGAGGASLFAYRADINDAIVFLNLHVTSPWALLAIIALVGGAGGLLHAYRAGSPLILPSFHVVNDKLTFFPGFLGNVAAGALAAIMVWLPTPANTNVTPPAASAAPADPAAGGSGNLLTPAVLIAAFVAGYGGANIATGLQDKNLFRAAVRKLLERPRDAKASQPLGSDATALEAFAAAGLHLPSQAASAPPAPASPSAAETELLRLFDAQGLRDFFAVLLTAGKPLVLRRDGDGLTLGALAAVQALPPPLRDTVKDLRLMDLAGVPLGLFESSVKKPHGTDTGDFKAALHQVWTAARDARNKLEHMPASWQLKPL